MSRFKASPWEERRPLSVVTIQRKFGPRTPPGAIDVIAPRGPDGKIYKLYARLGNGHCVYRFECLNQDYLKGMRERVWDELMSVYENGPKCFTGTGRQLLALGAQASPNSPDVAAFLAYLRGEMEA